MAYCQVTKALTRVPALNSLNTKYSPGSEISIDWKVHARSDKYYVKQFEETNLKCYLFLVPAALWVINPPASKYEYAKTLLPHGYLLLKQSDLVGLISFHEGSAICPPRSVLLSHVLLPS